jgi:hypothetical protein
MPADDLAWLIDRFPRFNAGGDAVFTARYLRRLRAEADARGWSPSEFLEMIEEYVAAAPGWATIVDPAPRSG